MTLTDMKVALRDVEILSNLTESAKIRFRLKRIEKLGHEAGEYTDLARRIAEAHEEFKEAIDELGAILEMDVDDLRSSEEEDSQWVIQSIPKRD